MSILSTLPRNGRSMPFKLKTLAGPTEVLYAFAPENTTFTGNLMTRSLTLRAKAEYLPAFLILKIQKTPGLLI